MIAEIISPATLGFILVAVMLFAIFVGFPISFTLIFLGFVFGYLGFGPLVFYLMTLQFSMVMTEQALAAVPLFVFMGIMMEQAGLMERLFSSVQLMLARVRGSLYYAVLFVSVIFAAATGIVGASVTILGIMAAKSMNKSGYDVRLAAGTITAGGTKPRKNSTQTCFILVALISSGKTGPRFGFCQQRIVVYPAYNKANNIPGTIAAANKSVTGISIIGPITTNIMLGGIKIPKVPPAVIVPAARRTSYPDLFIDLAAIIPNIVTEAPTIPVAAANITETKSTA